MLALNVTLQRRPREGMAAVVGNKTVVRREVKEKLCWILSLFAGHALAEAIAIRQQKSSGRCARSEGCD